MRLYMHSFCARREGCIVTQHQVSARQSACTHEKEDLTTSRFVRVIYSSHIVYNRVGIVSVSGTNFPKPRILYLQRKLILKNPESLMCKWNLIHHKIFPSVLISVSTACLFGCRSSTRPTRSANIDDLTVVAHEQCLDDSSCMAKSRNMKDTQTRNTSH